MCLHTEAVSMYIGRYFPLRLYEKTDIKIRFVVSVCTRCVNIREIEAFKSFTNRPLKYVPDVYLHMKRRVFSKITFYSLKFGTFLLKYYVFNISGAPLTSV